MNAPELKAHVLRQFLMDQGVLLAFIALLIFLAFVAPPFCFHQ